MNNELSTKFELKNGSLFWKFNRKAALVGQRAGSDHAKGYRQVYYNGKYCLEHQLVWALQYGYFPKQLDHINGNRQDNRIENLREATNSQNQKNTKTRITSKSGVKNVHWANRDKKWTVQMYIDGVKRSFGNYHDIAYAKFVADFIRYKHFGEFANHG
jgi:HNH endonuclease